MTATSKKDAKNLFKLISLDLADKVKAALASGVDPNVEYDKTTPLMFALGCGREAIARILLDAGADPKTECDGESALFSVRTAAWAKELIERGADVRAKTPYGATALHRLVTSRADEPIEIARVLLDHGAEVDALDREGKTPYACSTSHAMRAFLKERGAKPLTGFTVLSPTKSTANASDVDGSRGAIAVDDRGRLWCGAYSGLFVIDGDAIERFSFEESFAFTSIARGPKGTLYIATNWGLVHVDLASEKFTLYRSQDSELFDSHLTDMITSPDGRAYMIAYESGADERHITVFDGKTFSFLSAGVDFPGGIERMSIAFDEHGELVVFGQGALAYRKDGAWVVEKQLAERQTFPPMIYDVAIRNGTWVVGTQHGVYERKSGESKWSLHEVADLAKCVCFDASGALWVGTAGGGVVRIEGDTQAVFTTKNSSLADDSVENLVLAPDRMWIHADREPCFVRNGTIERLTGTLPTPPEQIAQEKAAKERKRKLVAFPKKPLIARKSIPKDVMKILEKPRLEGITLDELLSMIRPAIDIDVVKQKKIPIGASKFGGLPDLPADVKWPSFKGDRDRMLPFVLQIDLAKIAKHDIEGLLPKKGHLYFFSDTSPDELEQHRVIFSDAKKLARRALPEDLVDRKDEEDFVAELPEFGLDIAPVFTLPSVELLRRHARLTDEDESKLHDLREKLVGESSRILGWPDSVQEEVTRDEHGIVLLQLNGMGLAQKVAREAFEHWCSDGLIHFVIARDALAQKRFEKTSAGMAYT